MTRNVLLRIVTFVGMIFVTVVSSIGQDRESVQLYSMFEKTADGRRVEVTRMAISVPGRPWSGIPGEGLDFPISESRVDNSSALGGNMSIYGKGVDLDLSKKQKETIATLRTEFKAKIGEMVHELAESKGKEYTKEDQEGFLEKVKDLKSEFEEKTTEVLLPHQVTQLKQMAFAKRFRLGLVSFFKLPQVKKELEISDKQLKEVDDIQKKLAKAKRDLELEHQKKMKELVQKSERDTEDVLTRKQKKKLQELTGLTKSNE